jgi:putative chitinase
MKQGSILPITKQQIADGLGIPLARADWWDDHLNEAMRVWGITERLDVAAFLANVAHESGGLVHTREIWGPTKAQRRYEGRRDLGNIYPGDGKRFMAHGPIGITGRDNHREATKWVREVVSDAPDFEAHPELLELPRWGSLAAAGFWIKKKINLLAKAGKFTRSCIKVNGGLNGIADRRRYYRRLLQVL